MGTSNSKQVDASVKDRESQKLHSKRAAAAMGTPNSDHEYQSIRPKFDGATAQYTGTEDLIIQKFKQYSWFPDIEEMLRESKSLKVLVLGDIRNSTIVYDLIGLRLSDMSRSTITTDNGAEEIVVYRVRREGIDVTVWNAPSLLCDVTNRDIYVSEIEKILSVADLKLLYIDFGRDKEEFASMFTGFGDKFWARMFLIVQLRFIGTEFHRMYDQHPFLGDQKIVNKDMATRLHVNYFGCWGSQQEEQEHLPNLFFDCVRAITSQNGKGAMLKINLTSIKLNSRREKQMNAPHVPTPPGMRATEFRCGPLFLLFDKADVTPPTNEAPQPPPEQAEDKSEPVQELTHFYTGTHDLQFGAHGGGTQATPSGGPPAASNQENL